MTQKEFSSEVIKRFPFQSALGDSEKIALISDLDYFALNKAPNFLQNIYEEFIATEFSRRPGIWWFKKRDSQESFDRIYWRKCNNCGKRYQNKGRSCPSCNSPYFDIEVGGSYPVDCDLLQSDCSCCNIYEKRNDDINIFGPDCNKFGTDGKTDYCNDCKCRQCCRITNRIDENPEGFAKALRDGKIEFYWMKK